MRNKRLAATVAVLMLLAAREATADPLPIFHVRSNSTLKTEKGAELHLPPGYFLDEPTWDARDAEMRRLQELETRLKAENKSLRADTGTSSWKIVVVAAVVGMAVGGGVVAWQMK